MRQVCGEAVLVSEMVFDPRELSGLLVVADRDCVACVEVREEFRVDQSDQMLGEVRLMSGGVAASGKGTGQ